MKKKKSGQKTKDKLFQYPWERGYDKVFKERPPRQVIPRSEKLAKGWRRT